MTISSGIFEGDEKQIATTTGWGEFSKWATGIGDAPELSAIVEDGLSEDASALAKELESAIDDCEPSNDVRSVAESLLEIAKAATADDVIYVSNGMAADDEPGNQNSRPGQPAHYSLDSDLRKDIAEAAAITDTGASEAQKKSGNYSKGKFTAHGMRFVIETPKGATRSGTNYKGESWSVKLPCHYGYILKLHGSDESTRSDADGDHLDCFIGPDPESELAFVVDQKKQDGSGFDEHKILFGFTTESDAAQAYCDAYSGNVARKIFMAVTPVTLQDLREWIENGDTSKPFAERD